MKIPLTNWWRYQKGFGSTFRIENICEVVCAYFSNRVGLSHDVIPRLFKVNIDFAQIVRRLYKK